MMADPSLIYTVEDLARYWRVNPSTVYDAIRKGRLVAFKCGVAWRVTDEARIKYEEQMSNVSKQKDKFEEAMSNVSKKKGENLWQ